MWPKRSRLLLLALLTLTLLTAPYWVFQIHLLRLCSASCTVSRVFLYLAGTVRIEEARLGECANDTAAILTVFLGPGSHGGLGRTPTFVRLRVPVSVRSIVGLSPGCAAALNSGDGPLPAPSSLDAEPQEAAAVPSNCFNMSYSYADQAEIYPVLRQLERNFTERSLEIFLTGGSLLGSARHFGFIPWDDDLDFMIRQGQKADARELLVALSAREDFEFVDTERQNQHWRLGILCRADRTRPAKSLYQTGRLYPAKECRMGLDLFFGSASGELYVRQEKPFQFPLTDVYPLTRRPFGPYMMLAPANTEAYLAAEYDSSYHSSCVYEIHSSRFHCPNKIVNCRQLRGKYPFVTRLLLALPGTSGKNFAADVLTWGSQLHAIHIPKQ